MPNPEVVAFPATKRTFDVLVSAALLVLTAPLWAIIILAMTLEGELVASSRGKIFYRERRVSEGRIFMLNKFRVFKQESLARAQAESGEISTKELEKDGRNLTSTGRILRRVYLDELPQLWNVLVAEMTLVGPRPINLAVAERHRAEGKTSKFIFRAGLTGYFQSHKGLKFDLEQEQADLQYIDFCRRASAWKILLRDLQIIFISVYTVLRAEGI